MSGDINQLYEALIAGQEIMIGLFARSTIGVQRILEVVKRGKRFPDAYVNVYNALDGTKTGRELAKMVGVTEQALSYVLKTWEDAGIVYRYGATSKYKKLLTLPAPKSKTLKEPFELREEGSFERTNTIEN